MKYDMKFINQVEPWITNKERDLMDKYLSSGGWLTEFKETERFEKTIADLLGVKYAVATTSGTAALTLSLLALGIGRDDEVIVPNFTMIATPNAVKLVSAKPVFVDIEDKTLCMDINNLPISKKTKAIIHVSLNGRAGDIEKLRKICKANNIYLLEDACQAFASKHKGRFLGTFGDIGCFSLSPHKIISTGQGGIIVTNNKHLFENIKRLKDFGRLSGGADWHEAIGYNFKFTDLQAVIGIAQISNIHKRIKLKKQLLELYTKKLSVIPQVRFITTNLYATTPWFVDMLVPAEHRQALINYLKDRGIGTRPFYPPINSQPIYSEYSKNRFPTSEVISKEGLWLPSSLNLSRRDVGYVCKNIINYFSSSYAKKGF